MYRKKFNLNEITMNIRYHNRDKNIKMNTSEWVKSQITYYLSRRHMRIETILNLLNFMSMRFKQNSFINSYILCKPFFYS